MFKFLFGRKDEEAKVETQRQVATRALEELNLVLAGLEAKPAVKLDMSTGQIEIDWPDQMPDEALALPAPEKEPAPSKEKEIAEAVENAVKDGADKVAEKVS